MEIILLKNFHSGVCCALFSYQMIHCRVNGGFCKVIVGVLDWVTLLKLPECERAHACFFVNNRSKW